MKRNKGITLVALVITIIVLLILSAITIIGLTGENGIIYKTKQAINKNSISEVKEKLELAITELKIEENSRDEFSKEDLIKLNSEEIDVGNVENFPIEIIVSNYVFSVDENFNVTYLKEVDGTVITYTTEPEDYTNQNKLVVKVQVVNEKGINSIEKPSGTVIDCNGKTSVAIDFEVTKNGIYTLKIIDKQGNKLIKDLVIEKIDIVEPKEFTPTVEEIKATEFTIVANAEDGDATEESVKSGIGKYEYYINGNKNESEDSSFLVTNLESNTSYEVYVVAYDRAGNVRNSSTINVKTTEGTYPTLTLNGFVDRDDIPKDGLDNKTFDNDFKTAQSLSRIYYWFKVDPECWGKYITIYCQSKYCQSYDDFYGYINFSNAYNVWRDSGYLRNYTGINPSVLAARSVLIPNDTYWMAIGTGTSDGNHTLDVYEVWCSSEDLTGEVY